MDEVGRVKEKTRAIVEKCSSQLKLISTLGLFRSLSREASIEVASHHRPCGRRMYKDSGSVHKLPLP
jgi:hypothetical protein